jgi:putative transposon-encoded protein
LAKTQSLNLNHNFKYLRLFIVADTNELNKNTDDNEKEALAEASKNKVKFEIYGEEMIEKRVKSSGNSGRVYLPPNWVGHKVKIIRTD